jgi:hypothetical protein
MAVRKALSLMELSMQGTMLVDLLHTGTGLPKAMTTRSCKIYQEIKYKRVYAINCPAQTGYEHDLWALCSSPSLASKPAYVAVSIMNMRGISGAFPQKDPG